jgi:hypothetical protein
MSKIHTIAIAIVTLISIIGCDDTADEENNSFNNENNNQHDVCGNGVIADAEQCDGANLDGTTCEDLGFDGGGKLGCSNCAFDVTACHRSICGNGVLDDGEECDPGDATAAPVITDDATTCGDLGFYRGEPTCTSECTLSYESCSGRCGDGVYDEGFEVCDGTVTDEYGNMWEDVVWDEEELGTCADEFPGENEPGHYGTPQCNYDCAILDFAYCKYD